MNNKYDVIIIGAGPIGLRCGIESKSRNLSHLIIEKGCLVNSIYNYPTNMTFFSTSERLEIGGVPFVSHGDKPTRREALEYFRRVKDSWNLKVNTYEIVESIEGEKNNYSAKTDKGNYTAKNIIIATGFYDEANLMNVPGENLPKVSHYFKEAHPFAYLKLLIVGAGNSAVDVALETYRRGSDVTLVIREDKLKDSVKYWVKPDLENRIKEGSIKAFFNSEISEIRKREVDIKTPDGIVTVENDFVFAMTGYKPDFSFLKKIGINISNDESKTPQFDENTFETNKKGIYLAGVVCGGMETGKWFIENSRDHAVNIFDNIVNSEK
ncbi:MAG TPA: YpdA family putative bacillithiol disulfide reductase [Ignavibacteriaceae bacterium]|nr:YpdA family putative bacillithiol disulfide reductase [Ignavibacteriaceae bacterium]